MSDSNTRAYLFKFRGSDYVFCRMAGHGAEAQAQVVQKVSTGELLIRKVSRNRLDRSKCIEPNEFHLMEEYLSKPPRSPDIRPLIPKFYGYEKIPSKNGKFHLVSYWQLLNGGSVKDLILTKYMTFKHTKFNPDKRFPARLIARMLHQVFSSLQHLYTVYEKKPIFHKDLHPGNIWVHFPPSGDGELSDIPDFYLGDFGYAGWDFGFSPNHTATRDIDQVLEWARLMICINLPEDQRPPRNGVVPCPDDPHRGTIPGDAPMTAILSLYYDFCHELNRFKEENGWHIRKPSCPPPDLTSFIRRAEALEKKLTPSLTGFMLMTGLNESNDARVQKFMHDMKENAMTKARAQPFTMHGPLEKCLTPMVRNFPIKVHGPFYLAEMRVATGRWEAIDDVTYHRPGKTRGSGRGLRAISESPDEEGGETDSEPEF
ncbi:hypothetical protein B0H65DRAFT_57406 [Neurospora tetraspora]|uniref:Protein kinase domain-containing protein n=1 Tax=Neurospora tetraspora TaxID=94610 RepID=A0AAE0JQ68_9PEZI|nr:hypothetical protein B0H65DRAFT_57406 [Neurospora tetraspora]